MERHFKKKKTGFEKIINFINGGIAGIFGKSTIAPFNRIKYIFMVF